MIPFVLLGRKRIADENGPSDHQVYDQQLQLWVDKISGIPVVSLMQRGSQQTQFGETAKTATREGIDQTEGGVTLAASKFGETLITETREGVDRSEGTSLQPSDFGETVNTRTREGVDQTEGMVIRASQVGETTLTKTREGVDQTEGVSLPAFNASYSHF